MGGVDDRSDLNKFLHAAREAENAAVWMKELPPLGYSMYIDRACFGRAFGA